MKRLFALILVCMLVFALCACEPEDTTTTTQPSTTGTYEIAWTVIPDDAVVGAWEPEDSVDGEYVLFTDDGKLRVVSGTIVFDASINYGVDGYGNKSAYTEGSYLYGQWTYTVDGDTLTINYAEDDIQKFKRIDYTPITLQAKEDFVKDDRLVGKWLNKQYQDSYEFTEDGFVIFRQKIEDGIYVYETEIKHAYTVSGDTVTLYFYQGNDNTETSQSADFTIEGTKIIIGEADYYLNGEGSPEATTAPVIG